MSLAEAKDKVRRCSMQVKKIAPPAEVVGMEGLAQPSKVADPRKGKASGQSADPFDLPLPPFAKDVPRPDSPDPEAEILTLPNRAWGLPRV